MSKRDTLNSALGDMAVTEQSLSTVEESGNCLIIGLDFGTTFSGIAYGFSDAEKLEIHSIKEWPGLEGHEQPKVETLISYDSSQPGGFSWGAQARGKNPLVGIKLLLDPNQTRPLYIPGNMGRTALRRTKKSAEEVVTDYISALYKHAISIIENKFPAEYIRECRRKCVITVPAVWSDKAKSSTLKAAQSAGIHPIDLVTEPEAAALYTLHDMQDRSLEPGDAFVICDAGGGTVDLISYEVVALTPQLKVKELVPTQGGMAGSLVLNRRFEDAVQQLVGEEEFLVLKKKPGWQTALDDFDRQVKRAFRGEDEDFMLNFPRSGLRDDLDNNLEDNSWLMTKSTLEDIFSPVVADIEKLVTEQVNQIKVKRVKDNHAQSDKIKAIFLVGRFGSNQYVRQRLQSIHPEIQVIQPNNAWGAIVNGAVLSQMPQEAAVTSSIAIRHYGVSASCSWTELVDGEQVSKYWDAAYGQYRCQKIIWYIKKGDDLSRSEPIKFPFCRTYPKDHSAFSLQVEDAIRICDKIKAPEYPDSSVPEHVVVQSDISNAPKSKFIPFTGKDDKEYVRIDYELTLTPKSGLFRFALEIDGKEYGSVEARYA